MKPKTIVLMIVAIGFGLVAAWATTQIGQTRQSETVDVLVAIQDIQPGTVIREPQKMFKTKPFLKDQEPKNAVKPQDLNMLKGKLVVRPLRADAFCTLADLGDKFGLEVSKGMRAIAVQVTSEKVAGGFVLPNSRVDIVLTSRESGTPKADTILQNMRVLAVDQMSRTPDGRDSMMPTTVTLEMTPDDMLKLAAAKERGKIELVLRSYDDPDSGAASGTNTSTSSQPKLETVDVYVASKKLDRGTKLENVDELLKKKRYIKDEVPANAINDPGLLKGKTLSRVVDSDQFFTDEDFKDIVKPETVGTPPPAKKHVMIIINGDKTNTATFVHEAGAFSSQQPNENRDAPPVEGTPEKKAAPPTGGSEGK
jgi:pilus assembly protein CpaB